MVQDSGYNTNTRDLDAPHHSSSGNMFRWCNITRWKRWVFSVPAIFLMGAIMLLMTRQETEYSVLDTYPNPAWNTSLPYNKGRSTNSIQNKDAEHEILDSHIIQKQRQHILRQICTKCTDITGSKYGGSPCPRRVGTLITRDMLDNILVDDKHKALYCVIPKVGCTNWKRTFAFMSDITNYTVSDMKDIHVHDDHFMKYIGFRYLREYTNPDIRHRLGNYFKFMFVRHPLERLLSAYRDKFIEKNKYTVFFHHKYGRRIIKNYRSNPSERSLIDADDVKFEEFVKYITDLPKNRWHFNPHWAPFHELCHPCAINYDFIGKMETIDKDAQFIMGKIFPETTLPAFPTSSSKQPTTPTVLREFYRNISLGDLAKLTKVYLPDFRLFGYGTQLEMSEGDVL